MRVIVVPADTGSPECARGIGRRFMQAVVVECSRSACRQRIGVTGLVARATVAELTEKGWAGLALSPTNHHLPSGVAGHAMKLV
jgi:hypothetical protein